MNEDLAFELDDSELRRGIALVPKQFPFALALSLTRTTQGGQTDTSKALPKYLTIRTDFLTNPRKPGGFRVVSAKKDNLQATLGTRAPLMEQEVFGGKKGPGKAAHQAVPTDAGVGSTGSAAMRGTDDLGTLLRGSGKWPKTYVKGGGFFMARVRAFAGKETGYPVGRKGGYGGSLDEKAVTGRSITDKRRGHNRRHNIEQRVRRGGSAVFADVADKDVLMQKVGPQHAATRAYLGLPVGRPVFARYPVQAIYVFSREVDIKAKFPFQAIVEEVVRRIWPKQVELAVNEALWTAK